MGGPSVSTVIPSTTAVTQVRVDATPSTVAVQSKHTPIPQNNPLRAPDGVVRHDRRPLARSTAATDAPASARTGSPSTTSSTVDPMALIDPTAGRR